LIIRKIEVLFSEFFFIELVATPFLKYAAILLVTLLLGVCPQLCLCSSLVFLQVNVAISNSFRTISISFFLLAFKFILNCLVGVLPYRFVEAVALG
jgi:hypothetical protein